MRIRPVFAVALAIMLAAAPLVPAGASHPCPPGTDIIAHLGSGDNTVSYGSTDDCIDGQGGNDSISVGGSGDAWDRVLGGDGSDTLHGQAGFDQVKGDAAADTLTGGAGNDELYGRAGADSLKGEEDNDVVFDGYGVDPVIQGNAGYDYLYECDDNWQQQTPMGFEYLARSSSYCTVDPF